jgi:ADP-ribose pyrophosphatase YjhB (NUDIX family)
VECALRELAEETGIRAAAEDLHRVGTCSKLDFRGRRIASVFFLLRDVDPGGLAISEGSAIVLSFAEAATDPRLTEFCRRFTTAIAEYAEVT